MYTSFHQAGPLRRWAGTNLDATSFASKIPTITKPAASSTVAIIDLVNDFGNGGMVPTWWKFEFLLLGADNDVASFRFIGWNRATGNSTADLWVPQTFAEFSCTASAMVGIASTAVLNTERWCDTIAPVALMIEDIKIAAGTSLSSDTRVHTPQNDTSGYVIMPIRGYELLEFTLDQTTNTPTGNVLFTPLR